MLTDTNIKNLEALNAKYHYSDQQNYMKKYKDRKKPKSGNYTIPESLESGIAREMLELARKKCISRDEEESVKGYLLAKKMAGELDGFCEKYKIYMESKALPDLGRQDISVVKLLYDKSVTADDFELYVFPDGQIKPVTAEKSVTADRNGLTD